MTVLASSLIGIPPSVPRAHSCSVVPSVPIDSTTDIPLDLFERLLREGRRDRGQHRLTRSPRRGKRLVRTESFRRRDACKGNAASPPARPRSTSPFAQEPTSVSWAGETLGTKMPASTVFPFRSLRHDTVVPVPSPWPLGVNRFGSLQPRDPVSTAFKCAPPKPSGELTAKPFRFLSDAPSIVPNARSLSPPVCNAVSLMARIPPGRRSCHDADPWAVPLQPPRTAWNLR